MLCRPTTSANVLKTIITKNCKVKLFLILQHPAIAAKNKLFINDLAKSTISILADSGQKKHDFQF